MELRTTVRDFVKDATYHHIAPETPIRVIIEEPKTITEALPYKHIISPMMTPDEQKRRLNLIPGPATMTALEAMSDLYRTLPEDAGTTWMKDTREGAAADLSEVRDPWAS